MENKKLLENSSIMASQDVKQVWDVPTVIDLDISLTEGGTSKGTPETTAGTIS